MPGLANVNVRDEALVPALYSQSDKQFVALTSVASMVTLEALRHQCRRTSLVLECRMSCRPCFPVHSESAGSSSLRRAVRLEMYEASSLL